MSPQDAEKELTAVLHELGTGIFPDIWKSTFLRAATTVERCCGPKSPYTDEAKRIISRLGAIGADGVLGPGWDSPRGDMAGVLNAALADAKSGALLRGIWEAKNDTCNDVLEQAEILLNASYFAASAVLSGGALEAHLKDLCVRHGIVWIGDGSIEKYKNALAAGQKQKAITFFSLGDAKQVTAWGDIRNRAAHDPIAITAVDSVAIRNMLQGIGDFIVRVP